jgi:hypothetical protein
VGERASYDETSRTPANPADPVDHGSGSVDHIAFSATDYDELTASFARHGVKYRATQVPSSDLRQLFVFDPDGIQIEINIRSQPA